MTDLCRCGSTEFNRFRLGELRFTECCGCGATPPFYVKVKKNEDS